MLKLIVPVIVFLLAVPMYARGRSVSYGRSHASGTHVARPGQPHAAGARIHRAGTHGAAVRVHSPRRNTAVRCLGCQRDKRGRILRNPAARAAFLRSHPCPSTGRRSGACPGYVVDHIHALKHGGADVPANMQWQTKAQARAKDKVE